MTNENLKNLCLKLVAADTEDEVITILKDAGYWDNPYVWRYYGDQENNFATIGNQQSSPDAALVEKIINSVDAVLMGTCLERGIDPESSEAPQSMEEALEEFYGIKDGILSNIYATERTRLAENIMLVSTGQKSNPCYTIIDKGEGQTPQKMPNTLLSLAKSNKLRIPFVQGKFNMGGTGSLRFCGKHNIQLIISKRNPKIIKYTPDDETGEYWGFTIVRRQDPRGGMKSSTYIYLAPNNEILKFKADTLPLLPGKYPVAYEKPMEWGTLIKLYEYQMPGLKSPVYFDLYYRLSLLMPNIALPVLLYERRKNYKAQSYHIVLSGLSVRLEEDKYKNVEPGFPSSSTIKIKGQEMKIQIYAFKRGVTVERYKGNEGVIFTVNGQAHGFIPKTFYSRKSVGMAYLADSILIFADCSNFDGRTKEDLFMNSRDRLCSGDLKKEIEDNISSLIKNHQGLRELKEKRRREEIQGKIGDAKPLVEVLERVIKNSPTLSSLFIKGVEIKNPFNLDNTGTKDKFKGRKFPTYFKLKKEFPLERPKHCPINQRFRIQFETDAENNYFSRDSDPGEFILYYSDGTIIEDHNFNLWNGIATLTVKLPNKVHPGDIIEYHVEVDDITRINPFTMNFYVVVEPPIKKLVSGGVGTAQKPPSNKKGNQKTAPSSLALPNIIEVEKQDWEKYGFDKYGALMVKDAGENRYDFFINMNNIHLLTEIKGRVKADPELLKAQYKYGMVLLGLALIKEFEEREDDNNDDQESMLDKIYNITKAISPMLLPMISALSELEET